MKSNSLFVITLVLGLIMSFQSICQNHIELGNVNWLRDLDEGVTLAIKKQKPVLILFQEVPGCLTCRNYGSLVLSHPLIVEVIETFFVPVAIFNNKKGKDAEALTFFHEPSWNNPVIRIVNTQKIDMTKRVSGNYSESGLINAMIDVLVQMDVVIPEYLYLLQKEFESKKQLAQVYYSMYCFWSGEKDFGGIEGVMATTAGFMDGKEVVRVQYDPKKLALHQLTKQAVNYNQAEHVYVANSIQEKEVEKIISSNRIHPQKSFRADSEPKYYLSKTKYKFVPMTDLQASRVNRLIGNGKSPDQILSNRQLEMYREIAAGKTTNFENQIGNPIESGWSKVADKLLLIDQ